MLSRPEIGKTAVIDDQRFSAIPQELRSKNNFVCWRYEERNGKKTKLPYDVRTGYMAKSNDSSTWSGFDEAVEAASDPANNYDGIGFQLEEPFVGFDFDGVAHNGKVELYVIEVLHLLGNPYAEITPSQKGVRAIVKGTIPSNWQRRRLDQDRDGEKYGVEIYNERRYLTLTGNKIPGAGETVPDVDVRIPYKICLDPKFRALWLGDTFEYAGDDSRADLALCAMLKNIFGNDAVKIEEWFSKSRLGQRDKWQNRPDYRKRTIDKTIGPVAENGVHNDDSKFDVVMADTIEPTRTGWLWPKRVPLSNLTIFCGNPGNGKSLATVFLAATLTTKANFPDTPNPVEASEVLVLSGEDGIDDTLVPRLKVAGADLSKVHILKSVTYRNKMLGNNAAQREKRYVQLDTDVQMLKSYLQAHPNIKLVVIDPISNYLGKVKMTDEQNVRRVLMPVRDMAEDTNTAVVAVMHLNKKEELSAIHRVGGAMAFVGIARASWMFAADPENPELYYMLRVKVNIAARSGGLTYAIKAKQIRVEDSDEWYPHIEWLGTTDKTADTISQPSKPNHRPPDERNAAVAWLVEFLKSGPQLQKDVADQGRGLHGFSLRTLERAKQEIKAKSYKQNGKWYWVLWTDSREIVVQKLPM